MSDLKNSTPPCGHVLGYYWECRGDGYLWDADSDGYDPDDHSSPCPCCNTAEFLSLAKESAESTSYFMNMSGSGTGLTIWLRAVEHAKEANPITADQSLKDIGVVVCLDDENEVIWTYEQPVAGGAS